MLSTCWNTFSMSVSRHFITLAKNLIELIIRLRKRNYIHTNSRKGSRTWVFARTRQMADCVASNEDDRKWSA